MSELYILVDFGTVTDYMGTATTVKFYSVIHNNTLVIRTSNKRIAYICYKQIAKAPL